MLTSTDSEAIEEMAAQVREAARRHYGLQIRGANSKAFLGRRTMGRPLNVSGYAGVVDYQPSELVVTVRAGTPIRELEAAIAEHGQMLAFEPPDFGAGGTVGGMVAAGLSGPRRPFAGALRDFVLGVRVLDGRAQVLRFGGVVFKNVAGFDVSRLMAGAMGCLGIVLDVSLRLCPRPAVEASVAFTETWPAAQARLSGLMRRPLPLSGALHDGERLFVRVSGTEEAVRHALAAIGGDPADFGIWDDLRHGRLPAFLANRLWRLSVPRTAQVADLGGMRLTDWAGAQLWLATDAPAQRVRAAARSAGGHATLFHAGVDGEDVFEPLPAPLLKLHRRVKVALDPFGLFNRGRMYPEF